MNSKAVVAWSLLLALSGCGYSATRLLPAQYRTVYIEPFQNRIPITQEGNERLGFITNVPELEEKVTQAVIERFLFDGNLRVTSNPDQADLIISGTLVDFYRQAIRRQDDATVEEYRLNLSAALRLREKDGKTLLENANLVGDATYFVTGGPAKSETAAVEDLVKDFSRRVVEWVIEYW